MTQSRFNHVRRSLMASVCLACLIVVTTVDGHPSRELEQHVPPGDCSCYSYCCRYYYDTVDPGETITMLTDVAYPQSFRARVVKRLAEEDGATTANGRHDFASSPWQWQRMHLKKKNSEIISVLMGLRRAMSNNYENGVGERRQ